MHACSQFAGAPGSDHEHHRPINTLNNTMRCKFYERVAIVAALTLLFPDTLVVHMFLETGVTPQNIRHARPMGLFHRSSDERPKQVPGEP